MKHFFRLAYLLVPLSFGLMSCSDIENPEKAESSFFVPSWAAGKWEYLGDKSDKGGNITVTVYNDGSVIGSDDSIGSWFYADGGLYITWMDGWIDVIQEKGSGFIKRGFAPGIATDLTPTNHSDAVKVK